MSDAMAVVIPVYNRARLVREALDSVAAQTQPPDLVVVVDDGSTDGSAESVADWHAAQPRPFPLQLLRESHQGVSLSRNRGLAACGDLPWVAFLDSDDLWPTDFVARAKRVLSGAPDVVAATADCLRFDVKRKRDVLDRTQGLEGNATDFLFAHAGAILSATVVRTESVRQLQGFSPRHNTGEDTKLHLRLSLCGPWRHLPGLPATERKGVPSQFHEEPHLSRQYADRNRQWAMIFEEFAQQPEAAKKLSPQVRDRILSGRWNSAGRELQKQGRLREARFCFERSLHWKFQVKVWCRAALCRWRQSAA